MLYQVAILGFASDFDRGARTEQSIGMTHVGMRRRNNAVDSVGQIGLVVADLLPMSYFIPCVEVGR